MKKAKKASGQAVGLLVALVALAAVMATDPMTMTYAYGESTVCQEQGFTAHDDKPATPIKNVRK